MGARLCNFQDIDYEESCISGCLQKTFEVMSEKGRSSEITIMEPFWHRGHMFKSMPVSCSISSLVVFFGRFR